MSATQAATPQSYRLALRFDCTEVSSGEYIGFLDPNTSINISLVSDGNGNWQGIVTNPHPNTEQYRSPEKVYPGLTLPIGVIDKVSYSVQFTNEPDKRIFEAIKVTITGIEPK